MNNRKFPLLLSLALAGWCVAMDAWSAQAGRVQFVFGDVQLSDAAGRSRPLHKGDAVNEGDTLISAANASAQIKMLDGGFVAVRPETRLKFDSFQLSKKENEPESSFFSLFKGGFRAITGLIGKVRKQDYRITTPTATIGIRGTDHETVMVLPDSPLVQAGQAASGTYNKVNVGETSITTDRGTINVLPNQMGFAGGLDQVPKILPINTNLFTVAPPPSPGAKMEQKENNGEAGRATAVVDNKEPPAGTADNTVAAASSNTALPPNIAPLPVVVTVAQNLLPSWPAQVAGAIGFFYTNPNGTWTTGGGGTAQVTPTAAGGLGSFTTNANFTTCIANCVYTISFQGGSIGSASLLDQGANVLAGNLHWGRWFGQGASVTGLPAGSSFLNGNLTYIGGDIPTMPVTGTATYLPVGGTSPVDAAGNAGKFIGANVTVMFNSLGISVSNMQVAFGASTYTMAGSGSFLANGVIPSVPMSGSCTGTCPGGTVMNGDYAGAFTGTNAAGLGLAYHAATSGQTTGAPPAFEIMGSQAFIKQ